MSPLETSEAINQLNYKALGEILSSNIKSQWVHSYVIIQFYLILSKNYSTRPKKKNMNSKHTLEQDKTNSRRKDLRSRCTFYFLRIIINGPGLGTMFWAFTKVVQTYYKKVYQHIRNNILKRVIQSATCLLRANTSADSIVFFFFW